MNQAPSDFWTAMLFPPIMAVAYALILWSYGRMIVRGGRPLTPIMRGMLKYGVIYVLGACYLMFLGKAVGWPMRGWVALTVAWGVLVGLFAWWWHQRRERAKGERNLPTPRPLE